MVKKKQSEENEEPEPDDEPDEEEETDEEVLGTDLTPINSEKSKTSVEFEYKLSDVFPSIKHLGNVNIKATNEGLEFWGMNSSGSMMTQVKVRKDKIRNFNLKKDLEISTDTNYLKIVKRLYMIKAYLSDVEMIFEEGKTRFELPVFDYNRKKIPDLDLEKAVSFELSVSEVRKTINDISAIGGEDFALEFKDKSAVFTAKGELGFIIKTLEPYERGIIKYEKAKDSIKVSLSLELFKNALNGMNDKMRITIGENSPLIVENVGYRSYNSDTETPPTEKVVHYVAPRI